MFKQRGDDEKYANNLYNVSEELRLFTTSTNYRKTEKLYDIVKGAFLQTFVITVTAGFDLLQ